jgi:serine O-acetyltransferase
MIKSKVDYLRYLAEDLEVSDYKPTIKSRLFNEVWLYQRLLRKQEYYQNCKKGVFALIVKCWLEYRRKKLGNRLGFSIPCNVFGPGLSIPHVGTIVVNSKAKIGANCRIHVCVNIGAAKDEDKAPQIGDNVYIGPGAKIFGNINIGHNVSIGANAVVNKSFPEGDCTLVGIPAKKVL